jgi:hypothetical protein
VADFAEAFAVTATGYYSLTIDIFITIIRLQL